MKRIFILSIVISSLLFLSPAAFSFAYEIIKEVEPNDTLFEATPIEAGLRVEGNYEAGEEDWFVVTLDSSQKYIIGNSYTYPHLVIYDSRDFSEPVFSGEVGYRHFEEGTYYVKVDDMKYGVTGHYLFEISPVKK